MIDFGNDICFTKNGNLFRLRAAAVIIKNDCVLMAKNTNVPYFYSVGGAVQFGETVEQALLREVKEETGCSAEIVRLLAVHQNFFKGSDLGKEEWHELAFYYLTELKGETAGLDTVKSVCMTGAEEHLEWVPLKNYETANAYPVFFKNLNALLCSPVPVFITDRE